MNSTIKARIESIRRGEVPEGYKRTKAGILPADWEFNPLCQFAEKSRTKNREKRYTKILTNSANEGIISQTDYFAKQIANNDNIEGYFIVKKGDFVYNPRISVAAPCGPINCYHGEETGIMSPLYTVFSINIKKIERDYVEQFFSSASWHRYMKSVANYGVRSDRMNLSDEDFFLLPIPMPARVEQQKIAEILAGQDRVIALKEKLLAEKQKQKKYLMQQLLTAKKRLPGFSGEWKKVRMGTYVNFQVGYPFSSLHFNEEGKGLRLIKNRDLKTDDQIYYTTEHYSQDFVVTNGDVLIGMDGDFLPCVWNKGRALLNQRVGKIFVASGMDLMFSYYCLHIPLEKLSSKIGATTVKHLAHKDVESLFVFIPIEKPEQIAIAEILSTADKEIELLKKDIEQEKLKKKSLMQLLLTGIVRVDELVS